MPDRRTATDTYEYDAFGNQITHTGTTPNNYLYRGEQWDPDLGLYYLRARYYNPLTGRFMSRDPNEGKRFHPETLHKYLYAGGDPANAVDPTGRGAWEYIKITAYVVLTDYINTKLFYCSFFGFLTIDLVYEQGLAASQGDDQAAALLNDFAWWTGTAAAAICAV